MNLSGNAIRYWLQKEKLENDKLLVVVDDLVLPFGTLRLKTKGSDAGHNGLKSIRECLGNGDSYRIRLGVGRPSNPRQDVAAFLLQNFDKKEEQYKSLAKILDQKHTAIDDISFDLSKGSRKLVAERLKVKSMNVQNIFCIIQLNWIAIIFHKKL